jgi:hypothetical protein
MAVPSPPSREPTGYQAEDEEGGNDRGNDGLLGGDGHRHHRTLVCRTRPRTL